MIIRLGPFIVFLIRQPNYLFENNIEIEKQEQKLTAIIPIIPKISSNGIVALINSIIKEQFLLVNLTIRSIWNEEYG